MSERKNIDRLFQEKFKDFEANPPEDVWNAIEANLNKENNRRVIPLWWKLSGIVAVLVLGILLIQPFGNDTTIPSNPITVDQNTASDDAQTKKNNAPTAPHQYPNPTSQEKPLQNDIVDSDTNQKQESSIGVAVKVENVQRSYPKNRNQHTASSLNPVANRNSNLSEGNHSNSGNKVASPNTANALANEEISLQTIDKAIAEAKKENQAVLNTSKEISLESLKGSDKTVVETDVQSNLTDSSKTKDIPKNPLEELLASKEDEQKKQEIKSSKWQITSNVSPIFMGALSGGSAIDSTLAGNSKSYNTNVGFGLGVSYAVSPKFSIRTGLNKVNMNYNTNDVYYYASMQSRTMSGLNPSGAGYTIQVENANGFNPSAALVPSENELLIFEQNIIQKSKGYINQEIGYLEMPVEMSYALVAKRFGFKIIGGFSTLFLQDNSISVVSENRTTVLGEANNLNDIHFSTNIGLGIKYDIFKSFEFHVEPTFKYQINTFTSNAGDFRPYLFGVYSGFSYKF